MSHIACGGSPSTRRRAAASSAAPCRSDFGRRSDEPGLWPRRAGRHQPRSVCAGRHGPKAARANRRTKEVTRAAHTERRGASEASDWRMVSRIPVSTAAIAVGRVTMIGPLFEGHRARSCLARARLREPAPSRTIGFRWKLLPARAMQAEGRRRRARRLAGTRDLHGPRRALANARLGWRPPRGRRRGRSRGRHAGPAEDGDRGAEHSLDEVVLRRCRSRARVAAAREERHPVSARLRAKLAPTLLEDA